MSQLASLLSIFQRFAEIEGCRMQVQVYNKTFFTGYMDWCRWESSLIFSPTYPGETWNVKLHYEKGEKFNLQRLPIRTPLWISSLGETQSGRVRDQLFQWKTWCLIFLTFNIYSGASLPNLGLPSLFKMKDALREYFSYFPPRVFTCFLSQVK